MRETFIAPNEEQLGGLAARSDSGPVTMLNMLRFRAEAGEPAEGMTGEEAYGRYSVEVAPMLERVGGRVISALQCDRGIIGPADPEWDLVIVVEYPSTSAFLEMIGTPEYLEAHRYRAAALEDSRLVASTAFSS